MPLGPAAESCRAGPVTGADGETASADALPPLSPLPRLRRRHSRRWWTRRGRSQPENPRALGSLCGQSEDHGYATAGFAQHERRQIGEGAAKTRAPEDDIGAKKG